MAHKQLRKSVFSMGNFEIIQKVQAKDQATSTSDRLQYNFNYQTTFKDKVYSKKTYHNPKVIFHYFSPPGDLVAHPQLIKDIKFRSHSEPKMNISQSNVSHSSNKHIVSNKNQKYNNSPLFRKKQQPKITTDDFLNAKLTTPKSKRRSSNLSQYSKSSSKMKIANPQDELSRIIKQKMMQ